MPLSPAMNSDARLALLYLFQIFPIRSNPSAWVLSTLGLLPALCKTLGLYTSKCRLFQGRLPFLPQTHTACLQTRAELTTWQPGYPSYSRGFSSIFQHEVIGLAWSRRASWDRLETGNDLLPISVLCYFKKSPALSGLLGPWATSPRAV